MKHYVKIADGEVVNRTMFEDEMPKGWAVPGDEWIEHEDAQIGWLVDGSQLVPPPVPPAPLPTIDDYRRAIQAHVDTTAQAKNYDGGNSLASYVASPNVQWAGEAQAFVAWRDAVWGYAYTELEKVMNGEREQPSVEAFVAELPMIEWPL